MIALRESVPAADLKAQKFRVEVVGADRQSSGKWTISLSLRGTVKLPDGRELRFDRSDLLPVVIAAKQWGRRAKSVPPKRRAKP